MHDSKQPATRARALRRTAEVVLIVVAALVPAAPAWADSARVWGSGSQHHAHPGHFSFGAWIGDDDLDGDDQPATVPDQQPPATGGPPASTGEPAAEAPAGPAGVLDAPTVTAADLPLRGGQVAIPISCPAGAAQDCSGTVTIKAAAPAARAGSVRASRRGRKLIRISRRGRKLTFGRASFTVRSGRTATVGVRISRRGRKLVNAHASLRVDVGLVTRGASAAKHRSHTTVTLRATRHGARPRS